MASIFDLLQKALNNATGAVTQAASSATQKETYEGHARAGSSYTPPRLMSDPKARNYFQAKAQQRVRRVPGQAAPAVKPVKMGGDSEPVERDIEDQRIDWRTNAMSNLRKTAPSPSNPFGQPVAQTDPKLDRPEPKVTPEIKMMSNPSFAFDSSVVTPDYIKDLSRSDGDLSRRLAKRYLDEYSLGNTPDHPKETLDELTKLSVVSEATYSGKGAASIVPEFFKTVDALTRAPQEMGGKAILTSAATTNYKINELPTYYYNLASGVENPVSVKPETDAAKHSQYMAEVERYQKAAGRFDTLSKLATFSDGLNSILSLPSMYTAQQKGLDVRTAQQEVLGSTGSVQQNILQTGEQAGIIPFADAATFVNKLLDRGLTLDDEDLRTYRTGWSPEQYQKYDQQLRKQGTSLAQIVMEDGLTWSQLNDTLDLMRFSGEAKADIARSLGYTVTNERNEDVTNRVLVSVDQNRVPHYKEDVVGQRYDFDVSNPDQRIYYDDLKRSDFDLGALGFENTTPFADLVMTKHAVAALGRSKTAMFEDFIGSLLTDPTNFGPLQMVWKPMGLGIEAVGAGAKQVGKAAVKVLGLTIDVPIGVATTLGKLIRRGGDTVEKMTASDWTRGTDYLRYLGSETAQSAMWKEKNALFFGLQSALKPQAIKDGDAAIKIVDEYLPRLQEAARSGDWGVFVRDVQPGSARNVAQAFNSASDNLVRIASDEDALGHFVENFAGSFKDDLSKVEHDEITALAKKGDTAGLMKWSVERRLTELGGDEAARQAIDLNDVFNHVTNSYGAGVNVLAEKKLGVYGKELASPTVKKVNEVLNATRRVWTQALLSARPGYNIINYFDNAARLAANGYNPVMSAYDLEDELLKHMSPAQLRNELGVEMRAMTESVQDVMYVPEPIITRAQNIRTVLKDGGEDAVKQANKYVTEMRAATNGLPNIVKSELDKRINAVNLALSKYESEVGTLSAVNKALNEVENTLFQRQAGSDRFFQPVSKTLAKTPRDALNKLKEYGDTIRNGGNLVKDVYDDFINLGQSAHRNIEASAKMRVYGAEYLDRYQKYVSQIPVGNIPDIGNPQVQQALNEALHEAVLNPGKFSDAQAILDRATAKRSVPDAVKSWLVSLMPATPDGVRPLSDPLVTRMSNWMTTELLANPEKLNDPDAILSLMNQGQKYAESRVALETAEPKLVETISLLNAPTNRVPDFMANELSLGGAATSDPAIVISRLEDIQQRQIDTVQKILDGYVDVLHDPYNTALDQLQQKLPKETRLHRYEAMRDSFLDRFKGEATVGGEKVEVVGAVVSGRKVAPEAILADGRAVHVRDVKMTDPIRQQYFDSYKLWDATKESSDMLNKAGVARSIPGSAIEVGYDTGFIKAVPADVARDYTRKLEADLRKHGIELPGKFQIGRGSGSRMVNLRYDTPEDLIKAFDTGSGLMVVRERNANVFEGLNRVTDNWLAAERLTGSTSVDQLAHVKVGGKSVSEYMVAKRLDPNNADDVKRAVEMILDERGQQVTIKLRPGQTIGNKLGNKVTAPLSVRENSVEFWEKYARDVVGETRGQWIPVFDPNAPDGAKIVFRKLESDTPLAGAQIPLDTGSVIPDTLADHYINIEDAKEALEEAADAIHADYTTVADDFVPEQPVNVAAEIAQVADQPEPYVAFSERYPKLRSADDFVQRIAYLNARGATDITPEQAKDLATLLRTLSSTMLGGDDPDRLIKAMNFTDVFPRELGGELYSAVANPPAPGMTRLYRGEVDPEYVKTLPPIASWISESDQYKAQQALAGRWFVEDPELADWYVKEAGDHGIKTYVDVPTSELEKYRVSNQDKSLGLRSKDARNEFLIPSDIAQTRNILFQQNGDQILGLTKVSRELNAVMVGLFSGSNIDTALEEIAHAVSAILQMPKDILGKEFEVVRERFADDMEVIHEVCGAPLVKSETGRPQYTMFQKSLKLYDDTPEALAKATTIRNQARLAEERWAEYVRVYLQKGSAPEKLKGVFERFKAWLSGVFKAKYTSGDKVPVRLKMVLDSWIERDPTWAKQYNLAVDTLKGVRPETVDKFKDQADILHGLIDQINGGESVANFRRAIDETVGKLNNVGSAAISKDVTEQADMLSDWLVRMQKISGAAESVDLKPFSDMANDLSQKSLTEISKSIKESLGDIERAKLVGKEAVDEAYDIIEQKIQALGIAYEKSTDEVRQRIDGWLGRTFKAGGDIDQSYAMSLIDSGRARAVPVENRAEQLGNLISEMQSKGYDFKTEDDLIEALKKFDIENTTSQSDVNFNAVMADFWKSFSEVISDGEFTVPRIDNAGNITRDTSGSITASFKRGVFKPDVTLDQALRQERVGPMSLDELAALNAPKTVYISPERKAVLQYEEAVRDYLTKFYGDVENAVRSGHVPQLNASELSPENAEMARKWLEMSYNQIQDAAGRAQSEAAQKMRTVMMDFNTTYNLDVFMQQGPTLPKWTGAGGLQPLAVGGIVPFFKFPRMNIESWVNTLSNNPVVMHNVAKYNAAANKERVNQGMSEQALPSWPVRIGDQVYSVSPFGFMSLSQLLRPMNPYLTDDSSDIAQAISVAQQAGFSLGPTARIMTMALGIAPDVAIQSIIPQGSALIDPNSPVGKSIINSAPLVAKLIGLTTDEDEFGIQKQMVLDAFTDMKNASAAQRETIYSDLMLSLSTNQSARRTNAEEKYRQQRFAQSNTGYWTGVYPRAYSSGETDRLDYKQSISDITAAMDAVGLTPEQKDKLTSQMMGDPRRMTNTQYGALYKTYLPGDVTAFNEDEAKRNAISRRAQLNEYYQKVGELQANFQQKYGLSGTPIPQAESDKFYAELKLLNTQYADALQPSSVKRYAGQSDSDYQYQLGQSWLEYLKDSKPKMSQFPTYAEYERAVDKWYTDLPKTSAGMWELTSSLVGRKDPLPPYLADVSTKDVMKKFESQYDTASDAIYRVYTDNYYSGYWDALNGKSGPERLLAEMEYKAKYPVPSNQQIIDWVRSNDTYAKRFSNAELYRELGAHPVADIEQRYQFGKTIPERQAMELSNLLARIPPGNAYFKWRDSLDKDIQKHLQTYQDAGYKPLADTKWWLAMYEAVKSSLNNRFEAPDIATVREWVQAGSENKQMEAERDRLAPGFSAILSAYSAIDYSDKAARAAYRKANPEIGAYYDWLYNTWAKNHPVWNKYYGSTDSASGSASSGYAARQGVSYQRRSYSRGGGGGYSGSGGSYSSGSGYSASAQSYDKNWQPFQDFRRMAGDQLYGRLNDYLSGRGPLSGDETGLLQQLYKQYPFGASDYDTWLNSVLPSLISRFIPGHDFFKNPTYYSDAYPIKHYNKDLYWFDKTKKAR